MKTSLVSVVVPVYNGEKTIGKCLDSLIRQTLSDVQILCVDDGSTDKTAEILKKYALEHKNIRIISCDNGGRSRARNIGVKNCKTKYIMFCDDDDTYEKDMCKQMVDAIVNNNVDIAVCGTNIKYEVWNEMKGSDDEYYKLHFQGLNIIDDEIIKKTDVSVWNKIFKKEIIDKNHILFPDGLNNEDYYFYNAYMSVSKSIFFVNQRLYNYIRREDSIMSNIYGKNEHSMDHLMIAERLFAFYKKTGFLDKHTDLFWHQWSESFWFVYRYSQGKEKKKIVNRARKFVKRNYKEYKPISEEVNLGVLDIVGKKDNMRGKGQITQIFDKINIRRKQDNYINTKLETIIENNEKLEERLNQIKRGLTR